MRRHAPAIFAFPACPTWQFCAILGRTAGAQIVFHALPLAKAISPLAGSSDTLALTVANAHSGIPVRGAVDGNFRIGLSAALVSVLFAAASLCHVMACQTLLAAPPIPIAAVYDQQGNTQSKQTLTLHPSCVHDHLPNLSLNDESKANK